MMRTSFAGRLPFVRLSDDCEQEVLGLDLARSRMCRLNSGKANDHPGTRREGDVSARARSRFALQLVGENLPADAERFQCASGRGIAQSLQAENQVFGPDMVVVSGPRFGFGLLQQGSRQGRELRRASAKEGFCLSNVLTLQRAPSQVRHGPLPLNSLVRTAFSFGLVRFPVQHASSDLGYLTPHSHKPYEVFWANSW
jgi:hypothetical protein